MPTFFFCLFENTDCTRTRAEIRAVQPEPVVEAPGWIPRYVASLATEYTVEGAEIVLSRMNAEFAERRTARGLFDVPYPELRQWLDDQFALAAAGDPHKVEAGRDSDAALYIGLGLRVMAGITAALLFFAYVVANVWGMFYCMLITSSRGRSLVYNFMERSLIFRLLDWRKTIQSLVRIALGHDRSI